VYGGGRGKVWDERSGIHSINTNSRSERIAMVVED